MDETDRREGSALPVLLGLLPIVVAVVVLGLAWVAATAPDRGAPGAEATPAATLPHHPPPVLLHRT